jgi:hypothetical protein
MGFLQLAKSGKLTATEAIQQLREKAKKNNQLHFAETSSTMRKLKNMEAQQAK